MSLFFNLEEQKCNNAIDGLASIISSLVNKLPDERCPKFYSDIKKIQHLSTSLATCCENFQERLDEKL
jgi:hypothetical protein